jgi:hypothetical protein
MMINRRAFVVATGVVVAAPALASVLSRLAIAKSEPLAAAVSQPRPVTGMARRNGVAFRIEGWDLPDQAGTVAAGNEVWISVGRSWRTTWR